MITKKYYKLIRVSYADEGYFCLTNVGNSVGTVSIDTAGSINYEYSTDGVTWTSYTGGTDINVDPNSNIYWRYAGSGNTINGNTMNIGFDCYASGNLMSLYSKENFASYTGEWKARNLFKNQTHLLRADFNLGAQTTIGADGMNCMFQDCSSLTTTPDLSGITTVDRSGLNGTFWNCSSLTTGPDIRNITSVGSGGITYLFGNCSQLSIAYAPTITWDTSKSSGWLQNVAASGTLYADSSIASTIERNTVAGCPSGWTVVS